MELELELQDFVLHEFGMMALCISTHFLSMVPAILWSPTFAHIGHLSV